MSDILQKILATKAIEIVERAEKLPLGKLRERCESADQPRRFIDAIAQQVVRNNPAVICEIKKASPSKGIIRPDFDPIEIAKNYAAHGATCLSVLTDMSFFQGHDDHLRNARAACSIPVIRKDFIVDPYQVYESRFIGADAILLIVAALEDAALAELSELTHELGMDVLVEVHNKPELDRALQLPCQLIGINNRDLRTFKTSLDTTLQLLKYLPDDRIVVTESGINTSADIALMQDNNVNAFLVGEAFMRSDNPGEKLQELLRGSL